MNDDMITAIAQALLGAGVLAQRDDNPKQSYEKAVKVLTKHFQNEIHITWCIEDVKQQAREDHIRCSVNMAREVLQGISDNLDAEYGVNWQTLRDAIEDANDKRTNRKEVLAF